MPNTGIIVTEFGDEINYKYSRTDRIVSQLRDEMNEKLARVLKVLEMNRLSGLREGETT